MWVLLTYLLLAEGREASCSYIEFLIVRTVCVRHRPARCSFDQAWPASFCHKSVPISICFAAHPVCYKLKEELFSVNLINIVQYAIRVKQRSQIKRKARSQPKQNY